MTERIPAATTYAKRVLNENEGITKPNFEKPEKIKARMEICGISIVKIYKIIAFEKKEKSPRVIRLSGRDIMLKIGLSTLNIIERIRPPKIKVERPPSTFTPDTN